MQLIQGRSFEQLMKCFTEGLMHQAQSRDGPELLPLRVMVSLEDLLESTMTPDERNVFNQIVAFNHTYFREVNKSSIIKTFQVVMHNGFIPYKFVAKQQFQLRYRG